MAMQEELSAAVQDEPSAAVQAEHGFKMTTCSLALSSGRVLLLGYSIPDCDAVI
jgi:hypothetical protein